MKARVCLAAVVGSLAGCGGLSADATQWSIEIVSPVDEGRVSFCPAILDENLNGSVFSYDGTFAVPENVQVTIQNVNEDVYSFSNAFSPLSGGVVPPTVVQLLNTPMTFDMGPIGTVYDNNDPATVNYVGPRVQTDPAAPPVSLKRTLVGGSRSNDTSVELTYEYEPSCTTLEVSEIVDGASVPRSCTCETTSITFEFNGATL